MKLRIACVQFNPILGELERNKTIINGLLSKVPTVDIVVLPELSITGYNFKDCHHITPYLDTANNPQSTRFGQELSQKHQCFTVIGMPELIGNNIYNSAKLINPLGEVVYDYHKTFLYETDEVWGCSENPDKSFKSIDVILNKDWYKSKSQDQKVQGQKSQDHTVKDHKVQDQKTQDHNSIKVNFGICMDLNPYKFKAPFTDFEFARACYSNKAQLIICPMAWLSPKSPSIDKSLTKQQSMAQAQPFAKLFNNIPTQYNLDGSDNAEFTPGNNFELSKPDFSTVNYHILRFFPFMNHPMNELPKYGKVSVVVCNRIGVEDDVIYGGSSSMFQFTDVEGDENIDHTNNSVNLMGYLGQGNQGVLYREIDV